MIGNKHFVNTVEATPAEENLIDLAKTQLKSDLASGSFIKLANGSFEMGHSDVPFKTAGATYKFVPSKHITATGEPFYWETFDLVTGKHDSVEIQNDKVYPSSIGVNFFPKSGKWMVEPNPDKAVAFSQDIDTAPGVTVYWTLSYAKRLSGVERAGVYYGKVPSSGEVLSNPLKNILPEADRQKVMGEDGREYEYLGDEFAEIFNWHSYKGKYKIPVGQFKTRFQFISKAYSNPAGGNLMDDIEFASGAKLYLYNKYDNNAVEVGDKLHYEVVLANSGGMDANDVEIQVTLPAAVKFTSSEQPTLTTYDENGVKTVSTNHLTVAAINGQVVTLKLEQQAGKQISSIRMPVEAISESNQYKEADDNAIAKSNVVSYHNGNYEYIENKIKPSGNRDIPEVQDGVRIVSKPTLVKKVDISTAYYDDEVTYSLTLKNPNAYLKQHKIVVSDVLPQGLDYKKDSLVVNGQFQHELSASERVGDYYATTNEIRVAKEELAALQELTISFKVIVKEKQFKKIENTANVTYKIEDDLRAQSRAVKSNSVATDILGVIILHLRQVVLTPHPDLVIPTLGFFNLDQVNPAKQSKQQMNLTTASDSSNQIVPYTTTQINLDKAYQYLDIEPVMPSYYQNSGYLVTTSEQQNGSPQKGKPTLDGTNVHEYWVTIYLEPTINQPAAPRPYSWDYHRNNFGKVEIR